MNLHEVYLAARIAAQTVEGGLPTGALKLKGQVATVDDLPETGNADGDVYIVGEETAADKAEYYRFENKWNYLGETPVDLSDYVHKEEGKGLSANNYTDDDKAAVQTIVNKADRSESAAMVLTTAKSFESVEGTAMIADWDRNGDHNLTVCGKNLFDFNGALHTFRGTTFSFSNNVLSISGTADSTSDRYIQEYPYISNSDDSEFTAPFDIMVTSFVTGNIPVCRFHIRKVNGSDVFYSKETFKFNAGEKLQGIYFSLTKDVEYNGTVRILFEAYDKVSGEWVPYTGSKLQLTSDTASPVVIPTYDGQTNILTDADTEVVYPKNTQGAAVMNAFGSLDKRLAALEASAGGGA